jgi:hypothetical protein
LKIVEVHKLIIEEDKKIKGSRLLDKSLNLL